MQPYLVNVEAILEWWKAAMNTLNDQMQHLVDNNDDEAIMNAIRRALEEAVPDDLPDEQREEFIGLALKAAEDDPLHLMFGRFFAEMASDFMGTMGRGEFREIPGTTVKVSPLTNAKGQCRGIEIERSQMDDSAIQEIASNGHAAIEDFLKSKVTDN
jgi:hypothetical protein